MSSQRYLSQIEKASIHLPHAALSCAQAIAYPDLDIEFYLERLDQLHKTASMSISPALPDSQKAQQLAAFLFGPAGLRGDGKRNDDPRSSFLNQVLDRKQGNPITLSVVFIEMGRRMNLDVHGAALPGHFIARVNLGGEVLFIDPFHDGTTLGPSDPERLVKETAGLHVRFNPDWLKPVDELETLSLMLHDLRRIYLHQENWGATLRVLDLLSLTRPDKHGHIRDLGLIHARMGGTRQAIYYLESYLLRDIQATDAGAIRLKLGELIRRLSRAN